MSRYWGHGSDNNLGTRILDHLTAEGVDVAAVRQIPGCVSPSAAILVDGQRERLVCAYNDPKLDADASRLPLERDADCHGVLGDVRWLEGTAAVFDAAAGHGILRVFNGDVGPRDTVVDLAKRATPAVFSQPGLAHASGTSAPGGPMRSRAPSLVGAMLGPDGFLWREGGRDRHPRCRRRPAWSVDARFNGRAGRC